MLGGYSDRTQSYRIATRSGDARPQYTTRVRISELARNAHDGILWRDQNESDPSGHWLGYAHRRARDACVAEEAAGAMGTAALGSLARVGLEDPAHGTRMPG